MLTRILILCGIFCAGVYATEEQLPVRIQMETVPGSLDPFQLTDVYSTQINLYTVEPLLRTDFNGDVVPALAKSYEISKDRLTYRFHIRADAKWSDGKPITAEQVRRGFLRVLTDKESDNADQLYPVKGARAYALGKGKIEDVAIRAEGSDLILRLERPNTPFIMVLTLPLLGPLREDQEGKWSARFATSGRYFIKSYKDEREILLEPNPHNKIPGQRPVLIRYLDSAAGMNLFEAGKMDILTSFAPAEFDRLNADGLVVSGPTTMVAYLAFNPQKAPFTDPLWRKAVAGAIDRDGLKAVIGKVKNMTESFIPRTFPGALDIPAKTFADSVVKARNLQNKPKIYITYASSPIGDMTLQRVQADLKKKLNVDVEFRSLEWKVLLNQMNNDPPALYLKSTTAPFKDATIYLQNFSEDLQKQYKNSKFESLLKDIFESPAGAKREKLIREAQKIALADDVIAIPLYGGTKQCVVAKSVKNIKITPFGYIALDELR